MLSRVCEYPKVPADVCHLRLPDIDTVQNDINRTSDTFPTPCLALAVLSLEHGNRRLRGSPGESEVQKTFCDKISAQKQ